MLGAHNLASSDTGCVSLLLDGVLALDAGSLASRLSFSEQARLAAVLLSHRHYDHIRDIPALGLNLFRQGASVDVYCSDDVRSTIVTHLLDSDVFPGLHEIPAERPAIRFRHIEPDTWFTVGSHSVKPVLVSHVNHTLGFEVRRDNRVLFYTADTGPLPEDFWAGLRPGVLVAEVTAPNSHTGYPGDSGHLTPALLENELTRFRRLHNYVPTVLTVHMDPLLDANDELEAELAEVANRLDASITLAHEGMELDV